MLPPVAAVDASSAWSVHRTLTPATVDTVTFGEDYGVVEVLNRNGAGELYFTVDGAAPVVAGNSTHVLPAAISAMTVVAGGTSNTVVRLISAAAVAYSVRSA